MAATYGMGYAGEQLGLPGEVTWILSVATGCTVSMVGGKLLFRDIDKGIIQECTTEDMAKITGETSGTLDMTQVGKSVTAEEIDIYLQYKKEGSLYRFSKEERETIQRVQRMDIPDEELKKVLQVKQSIVIENVVNEGGTHVLPNAEDLKMSQTVQNHMNDVIKKGPNAGQLSRPYIDSDGTTLLLKEIMESADSVPDTILQSGLRWDVSGTFRGSTGTWELVVDTSTNTVVHFNFVAQ